MTSAAFDFDKPIYSRKRVCEITGRSMSTLERAIKDGRIAYVRRGRTFMFSPNAVAAWVDAILPEYSDLSAMPSQPAIPGLEHISRTPTDAPFSSDQAAGVASVLAELS